MSFQKRVRFFLVSSILSSFLLLFTTLSARGYDVGPEYRYKFGVVSNNANYQIFRSSALGKNGLRRVSRYMKGKSLPLPQTIIYMNSGGYSFPFYFALDEYKKQDEYQFQFFHSFGNPRTYLDGHNPYNPSKNIDTSLILGREARKYFDFEDDRPDGGVDRLFVILDLILDPVNQPVLFHCHGGRHRTGMFAMILRHMQGGVWTDGPVYHRRGMKMNLAEY